MEFGIPAVRQPKTEKYPNEAYITFEPTGEGLGRKMILSNKAKELLNITDENNQISFSFAGANIYIVNTSGEKNASGLKVGKTTSGFADKKHYNYIKSKTFNIKDEDSLELFFKETNNEFNGNKVYQLIENTMVNTSPCSNHDEASNKELDDIIATDTYMNEEPYDESLIHNLNVNSEEVLYNEDIK